MANDGIPTLQKMLLLLGTLGWRSLMGLSSERARAPVGASRARGSGLAAGSAPLGLAGGRALGSRLAAAGDLVRRAFLVNPSLIVLAAAACEAKAMAKAAHSGGGGSSAGTGKAAA